MSRVSANQDSFSRNFTWKKNSEHDKNEKCLLFTLFSPLFLQVNVTSNRPVGMRGHTLNV